MTILDCSYQQGYGIGDERLPANGFVTDGASAASVAGYINMIAARRFHILAQGGDAITAPATPWAPVRGSAVFHTSPNCGGVEGFALLGTSASTTVLGSFSWQVAPAATASETQEIHYIGGNGTATAGPDDIVIDRIRFKYGGADLLGDTVYWANLFSPVSGTGNLRLLYYVIYELPRTTLDTTTHTAIPVDVFGTGAPILDRDVATMTDALWKIYRRQGPPQIYWSDTTSTPPSTTGLTWRNILDGSTAGYSANAAGFWTIPYRKNRLTGNTVDVVLWSRQFNSTANGEIRFVNSAGIIGSIIGMTGSTYSTTATMSTNPTTSDLVIIEHRSSNANPTTTLGAGMYEYLA